MSGNRLWPLSASIIRNSTAHQVQPTVETCIRLRPPPRAGFRTLPPRREHSVVQRYGTANEPPAHLIGSKGEAAATKSGLEPQKSLPELETKAQLPLDSKAEINAKREKAKIAAQEPAISVEMEEEKEKEDKTSKKEKTEVLKAEASGGTETTSNSKGAPASPTALSQILSMDPPMAETLEEKPPHLTAPPYVHHFDTFTLVRALQENKSFTEEQAVTIMKAVRGLLSDNMALARAGIMSRGDAEMEVYLFRAACNELRTEMRNNRATLTERMRTERTMVQHEVDILAQRITADTGNLKDELKGMFDDRKMNVRMERRDIENKIQELNYHITSRLNSEMRSDVEGLRWVLVRRTAIAIVIVASTALVVLRLNSVADRRAESGQAGRKRVDRGKVREQEIGGGSGEVRGTDLLKGLENGGDPSLVSLG